MGEQPYGSSKNPKESINVTTHLLLEVYIEMKQTRGIVPPPHLLHTPVCIIRLTLQLYVYIEV